ncbi:hypothetical protein NP493_222g04008 [Ridgeia piscesae]|uniref:G-protein coupled receptors family 1 profile domain-containing protein n=1 Tax=Ridgeia piscesae TaxID=27915 RepID=A0AAD9UDZ2_RIDPI|nr:hypothetical protein NP493_222g04008 [Ridgeia piscesae]
MELAVTESTLYDTAVYSLQNVTRRRPPTETSDGLRAVALFLRTYYTPTMVALGVVGNLASIVVFTRTCLARLSCGVYLGASATANTIFLLSLTAHWLRVFGVDVDGGGAACQFVAFVDGACAFLSVWFVVAYATDSYIAVCRPRRAERLCTTFRAKVVSVLLVTTAVIVYINLSLTVGAPRVRGGRRRCRAMRLLHPGLDTLAVVDIAINVVLPYAVLLAESVLVTIRTFARRRHLRCTRNDAEQDAQAPDACALVTFVIAFLLLRVPRDVGQALDRVYRLNGQRYFSSLGIYYRHSIAQHLYNTSYCIHLFVHLASFRKFRACAHELLTRTSGGEAAESEMRTQDAETDEIL